jgi:hypothetical protein
MMLNSRYFTGGASTTCAHCKQPLPIVNGHMVAWRSTTGDYFCNEFCADDAEEGSFQYDRRAS